MGDHQDGTFSLSGKKLDAGGRFGGKNFAGEFYHLFGGWIFFGFRLV